MNDYNDPKLGSEPQLDCSRCSRLVDFRKANITKFPDFHNAPVPSFGPKDARLLVVGMAPGLKGANWSGRPFTGDYAGDLLYDVLHELGFAEGSYDRSPSDGLTLKDCRITNAVRCVPPQNKVTTDEAKNCAPFLLNTLAEMPNLKVMLILGKVAHDSVLRILGFKLSQFQFGHGSVHRPDGAPVMVDSYHCSRYNVNTGRLTRDMFLSAVSRCRDVGVGT